METSYYSEEELKNLNFQNLGTNVSISRKASIYGAEYISIGDHVRIDDFSILSGQITIGNYVHIGAGCYLFGGDIGIDIDDYSGCSHHVCIYAISDDYSGNAMTNPTIPNEYRNLRRAKVHIEKYVIIGSGSIIFPAITIGEGTAIGSLSLVKESTNPWKIYSGNPARTIGLRSKKILKIEEAFRTGKKFTEN